MSFLEYYNNKSVINEKGDGSSIAGSVDKIGRKKDKDRDNFKLIPSADKWVEASKSIGWERGFNKKVQQSFQNLIVGLEQNYSDVPSASEVNELANKLVDQIAYLDKKYKNLDPYDIGLRREEVRKDFSDTLATLKKLKQSFADFKNSVDNSTNEFKDIEDSYEIAVVLIAEPGLHAFIKFLKETLNKLKPSQGQDTEQPQNVDQQSQDTEQPQNVYQQSQDTEQPQNVYQQSQDTEQPQNVEQEQLSGQFKSDVWRKSVSDIGKMLIRGINKTTLDEDLKSMVNDLVTQILNLYNTIDKYRSQSADYIKSNIETISDNYKRFVDTLSDTYTNVYRKDVNNNIGAKNRYIFNILYFLLSIESLMIKAIIEAVIMKKLDVSDSVESIHDSYGIDDLVTKILPTYSEDADNVIRDKKVKYILNATKKFKDILSKIAKTKDNVESSSETDVSSKDNNMDNKEPSKKVKTKPKKLKTSKNTKNIKPVNRRSSSNVRREGVEQKILTADEIKALLIEHKEKSKEDNAKSLTFENFYYSLDENEEIKMEFIAEDSPYLLNRILGNTLKTATKGIGNIAGAIGDAIARRVKTINIKDTDLPKYGEKGKFFALPYSGYVAANTACAQSVTQYMNMKQEKGGMVTKLATLGFAMVVKRANVTIVGNSGNKEKPENQKTSNQDQQTVNQPIQPSEELQASESVIYELSNPFKKKGPESNDILQSILKMGYTPDKGITSLKPIECTLWETTNGGNIITMSTLANAGDVDSDSSKGNVATTIDADERGDMIFFAGCDAKGEKFFIDNFSMSFRQYLQSVKSASNATLKKQSSILGGTFKSLMSASDVIMSIKVSKDLLNKVSEFDSGDISKYKEMKTGNYQKVFTDRNEFRKVVKNLRAWADNNGYVGKNPNGNENILDIPIGNGAIKVETLEGK